MNVTQAFKARAHLLKLLGDELIGDDRLAVFELVKNAYDADATEVDLLLKLDGEQPKIIITDNGTGMSQKILLDKWLEIGTDSKRGKNRVRSPKFGRMPLGEKGVGRLAVHKLGAMLSLNTRAEGHPEYRIHIDWPDLIGSSKYLDEASIRVHELPEPKYFKDGTTGTRIAVTELYTTDWSRRHIRSLKKMVTSLVSPFVEDSGFNVQLRVPGREEEIEDILDVKDVLDRAIWIYEFAIDKKGVFGWHYHFTPPSAFRSLRKGSSEGIEQLELLPVKGEGILREKEDKDKLFLTPRDLNGIGPITGRFYVYFRRREVLNAQGAYQQIVSYLDEQTGVRIYRDGVRVFNYGEPGEDWLGLNADRINKPGKKIGTDSIIGTIELDLSRSQLLKEKTNREGFDENETFRRLRIIIQSVVGQIFSLAYTVKESPGWECL
ncbi:MAG: ATP-binding protein [Dissulfurispiraceae bacterium]